MMPHVENWELQANIAKNNGILGGNVLRKKKSSNVLKIKITKLSVIVC